MRIAVLKNESFERAAHIGEIALKKRIDFREADLSCGERFPGINDFDLLVIMGGPMNVYEEKRYPWLRPEKEFIVRTIRARKKMIGICLGAQLIACCLGAKVRRNREKEIGWFRVNLTKFGAKAQVLRGLPGSFYAFHWHGDTFSIPRGARRLAFSEACKNQAFVYGDRVLALQFHLETTPESTEELINNCRKDLTSGRYVMSAEKIRNTAVKARGANLIMERVLENLIGRVRG
ncbi:MAG TPA: type 1 glutamine amidotransferase [bacterium]|nr:type 1 glutamine amidotransferase [bacterium]